MLADAESTKTAESQAGRSSAQLLAAMEGAIAQGDANAASLLLAEAAEGQADDPSLRSAIASCQSVVRRSHWLTTALTGMRHDLAEDRFTSAVGHFRQALALSRGLPLLKARVDRQAEKYSEQLLPQNWRIAQTLLREAAEVEPALKPDAELQEQVKQACHEEWVSSAIYKADRFEQEGECDKAREALNDFLRVHPQEPRILKRLRRLDEPDAAAVVASPDESVAKLITYDAVPPVSVRPPDSELDTEGTLNEPEAEGPAPWRTRVFIPSSAIDVIKNIAAVGAALVMLGLAGWIVWRHFAAPPKLTRPSVMQAPVQSDSPASNTGAAAVAKAPSGGLFQDVPEAPSDQDAILHAVGVYSQLNGKKLSDDLLDEVAISGNQATVRYRPKNPAAGVVLRFTLAQQAGVWRVKNVQ